MDLFAPLDELLEHDGTTDGVDFNVATNFVHRLSDANDGGEVDDGVDGFHRLSECLFVPHVADDQLDVGIEIVGSTIGVYLRGERIERPHLMTRSKQAIGEVRANKSGAACDEHTHTCMVPGGWCRARLTVCCLGGDYAQKDPGPFVRSSTRIPAWYRGMVPHASDCVVLGGGVIMHKRTRVLLCGRQRTALQPKRTDSARGGGARVYRSAWQNR